MTAQVACTTSDLAPEEALRADLVAANGSTVEVAVVRDGDGNWHAISDICSHGQVSLSDGEVEGCYVECWLHGSQFDLRDGMPTALPAIRPVPVYPVTVDGEQVLVDVDAPLN
ncbi:non-heme iron oxygenase ferredoxin subunit [Luteimicrobium subarcticum]|uniref:3-phenylpropionate/trans-cinnamate dioxygenase ferredoxin subunit n=1 Tax=Luteimicrobium subarcticum TaxID=620910 RepID=A0A2M8WWG8_9MICO|nr:non-heme iron oxygenase ferredoxin subunit [Luteimicrobium subarcticum]PJI95274.1 3-phenylpropionate/trans-cinnamate dioxygenase ferredoxin subunit [Luteimicrobium subarcticum]